MTVKTFLKRASATVLGRWMGDRNPGRVVVLCYHSVHPAKSFSSASPEIFDSQLRWLKGHADVISFGEVFDYAGSRVAARPAVAITFDDGYSDNYEYAFPILQKHGLSATFFLTAGLIEEEPGVIRRFVTERGSPYEDIRPLRWAQVREMRRAGMEIGAHTYGHPNLAHLSRAQAAFELRRSKDILEQQLGERVPTMAYPYGKPGRAFTEETAQVAAESGYEQAAAVLFRAVRPSDSRYQVPRFIVERDEAPERLSEKVLGWWDHLGTWQEKAPRWAARLVSPRDFVA